MVPVPAIVAPASSYFGIRVVDAATGRGVPLVELRTTGDLRFVTDSAGWIAFFEPGLMERRVWFAIKSHGYEFPADGFGFRGVALTPVAGARATITIRRVNIAERLCRLTGAGIYRDTLLIGERAPLQAPLLNAGVVGQDSVMAALYRGKLRWFWGDTNRPEYPLGHFGTAGATSAPGKSPASGIDYAYFADTAGFSRPMLPVSEPGAVWISGLAAIEEGAALVCSYARMKDLGTCLERGLAVYEDAAERFTRTAPFDPAQPAPLSGHPFLGRADGKSYLFGTREGVDPLPCVRVAPTVAAMRTATSYEVFGQEAGVWGWRRGGTPSRAALALRDIGTGKPIEAHAGSVYWNAFRNRWILIVQQKGGESSLIGEIWFSEADTPVGPWVWARKIVTHERYDFYNPTQHPFFDEDGGRTIYFEGTYVNTFSGNPDATPRYNYNQILYRLDLADPRLSLPAPVYRLRDGRHVLGDAVTDGAQVAAIPFFAMPPRQKRPDLIPIWADGEGYALAAPAPGAPPLFFGLPATAEAPGTVPLPGVAARVWQSPTPAPPFDFAIRPERILASGR